ncbi:MAG TPA: hypothetical protein DIS90_05650 [Cytophagales bacterium]|nr:hypothetical protein [Cytophagales bacterium]
MLALVFLWLVTTSIQGCKSKGDDPLPEPQTSEQEKVTALLTAGTGTWAPSAATNSVIVAGFDVTEEFFSDFTIRFSANQLFTTGTTPVWLRQDTWQFKSGTANIIIRGQDSREVKIENISETELKLTLDWPLTTFGGRTRSLPGTYVFTLKK